MNCAETLVVGMLLLLSCGWTNVSAEEPTDAVRLLRAENGLLEATIEAHDNKIEKLQEEIKNLQVENDKQAAEIQKLKAEIVGLGKGKNADGSDELPAPADRNRAEKNAGQPSDTDVESPVLVRIGDGQLRVRFQFTTLYIPANIPEGKDILVASSRAKQCGYSRFLFVAYRPSAESKYEKPIRGFFKINEKAEKVAFRSSNAKIVRVISYDDDEGLRVEALRDGSADIVMSLGTNTVKIPFKVIQIPVNTGDYRVEEHTGKTSHTQDDVIKILGLPDKRKETLVAWPKSKFYVGQLFDPEAGASWNIQRWTYKKYPGAEIIFVGRSNAYYARSAQEFDYAEAGNGE